MVVAAKRPEWRNAEHARQWATTLETYCAAIRDTPIDAIDTAAVVSVLTPLWQRIPTTASRLRNRIEIVLDHARAKGLRSGENPARWRGHLALILPERQRLAQPHHAAMDYRAVPAFLVNLRSQVTIPRLCLEFLILTAARSGEARLAAWSEIDLDQKVWTLPPARMKSGETHRVPLSDVELLQKAAGLCGNTGSVFPGRRRRSS